MSDANSILSMTEHGAYVWPSYGIVALVLIGLMVQSLRALKRTRHELERAEQRLQSSKQNSETEG